MLIMQAQTAFRPFAPDNKIGEIFKQKMDISKQKMDNLLKINNNDI